MDPDTVNLIVSNSLLVLLFAISEALPFVPNPYQGILHAIVTALEQNREKSSTN